MLGQAKIIYLDQSQVVMLGQPKIIYLDQSQVVNSVCLPYLPNICSMSKAGANICAHYRFTEKLACGSQQAKTQFLH